VREGKHRASSVDARTRGAKRGSARMRARFSRVRKERDGPDAWGLVGSDKSEREAGAGPG
jgi:hypothetical protein